MVFVFFRTFAQITRSFFQPEVRQRPPGNNSVRLVRIFFLLATVSAKVQIGNADIS